jgi:uncharacterized protein YegP (UPF0339 family)
MNRTRVEFYEASRDDVADPALAKPEWRWRLRAANGEIVASGEGHASERDARRAFDGVTKAVFAAVFVKLETGEWPE